MPKSLKVVPIERRRNHDILMTLRQLMEQAEAYEIRGFAYVVEYSKDHDVGAAGTYRRKPSQAVGPAMDLVDALRALPDQE